MGASDGVDIMEELSTGGTPHHCPYARPWNARVNGVDAR